MYEKLKNIKFPNEFQFDPNRDSKSSLGFVGLKNLGATCYMNAILQQCFLIEPFKFGILSADDQVPENISNELKVDDNLLHQLKDMYSFLSNPEKREYDTAGFAYSFKDPQGNPTKVFIQQDAQEFLVAFFDCLEKLLKNTPFRNLIQSIFVYQIENSLKCRKCNQNSTTLENQYYLPLNVKHFQNFDESIKSFFHTEIISGYKCENCNQVSDVEKKICLHSLPNILIVHLQRIIFNLEKGLNEKVHSRFKFPKILKINQYINQENLKIKEDEESEYKLVGVVIHVGCAIGGHFYSIINVNRNQFETSNEFFNIKNDKWVEFNDSSIFPINYEFIESECFGGTSDFFSEHFSMVEQNDSSKCAYMLFYEKFKKNDIKLMDITKSENNIFSVPFYKMKSSFKSIINLKENLDEDSTYFLSHIFSSNFLSCFIVVLRNSLSIMEDPRINIPTDFIQNLSNLVVFAVFNLFTKVKDENHVFCEESFAILSTLISNKLIDSNLLLDELLKDNFAKASNVLLNCPYNKIRNLMKDLIKEILMFSDKSYYVKIASLFLNLINEDSTQSWNKFTQIFETIENLIKDGGQEVIKLYIEKDFLFILSDFFLGKSSPFSSP